MGGEEEVGRIWSMMEATVFVGGEGSEVVWRRVVR